MNQSNVMKDHVHARNDTRSIDALRYRSLYKTKRWALLRSGQLSAEPCCEYCAERGFITGANVVDHITAHRGDVNLFHDPSNLQSLCKRCHDSDKRLEEERGYKPQIQLDGWPADKRHPVHERMDGGALHDDVSEATGPTVGCRVDLVSRILGINEQNEVE